MLCHRANTTPQCEMFQDCFSVDKYLLWFYFSLLFLFLLESAFNCSGTKYCVSTSQTQLAVKGQVNVTSIQ